MHLHFERSTNARSDCAILSLTWMGKVPDEIPDDDGWKLNRTNYYQEGWLASGNVRGIVGVTFTTCHCKKIFDSPLRTNYNLRGHRSEVTLVKWNEPYQKLASCDSSGIIFVWIKYEGRWSIELINDRNTQVTDFSWSHDGRMALICYQDGFVLVGSVAGQRYWSSMLNLEGTITCGVWTPDDQQVFFGTTDGHIIVMDVHGTMVAQVAVMEDVAISGMAWSCEKFKMEETDDMNGSEVFQRQCPPRPLREDKPVVLTVCFHHGVVYLMKNYDDLSPTVIHTGLRDIKIEWSNSGEILAVSGNTSEGKAGEYQNIIQFFNGTGVLRYSVVVPNTQNPVSALTWGHNDKRLFVATGCLIHIAWVNRKVASLQFLCRLAVHGSLHDENQVAQLPIPHRLCSLVSSLFAHTIKCYVPHPSLIREFVNRPPTNNSRLHCTMIRHDDDLNLTSGACYTLYLEYLGGLVPLLKGKRTSKIRPEFVIYDPQVPDASSSSDSVGENGNGRSPPSLINGAAYNNSLSDYSDSEYEDSCASPRMQRRRRQRRRLMREQLMDSDRMIDELAYIDTLPEQEKLVEVTSNIWGTKFKIHGISSTLPANLGQVTYKTSLLHLQPRQMTVVMTELRDDLEPERDPSFNPNVFSEDEDEQLALGDGNNNINGINTNRVSLGYKESIPIAPMTPRRQIPASRNYSRVLCNRPRNNRSHIPGVIIHGTGREIPARFASLAQPEADSESDEYSYVDFTAYPEFKNLMEANRRLCASAASPASSPLSSPCQSPQPARHQYEEKVVSPVEQLSVQVDLGAVPKLRGSDESMSKDESGVRCSVTSVAQTEVPATPSSPKVVETPKVQKDNHSNLQPSSSCRRTGLKMDTIPRWAERARGLKYIDDDDDATLERILRASSSNHHVYQTRLLSKYHSRSVGQLNSTDILALPAGENFRTCSLRETKRRLILSPNRPSRPRTKLQYYGKSRSLDSGILSKELLHTPPQLLPVNVVPATKAKILFSDLPCTERVQTLATQHVDSRSLEEVRSASALQSRFGKCDSSSDTSPLAAPVSKSVSSTPTHTCKKQRPKSSSPIRKSLLNSPLLSRKSRRTKVVESSDEEMAFSGDEILTHSFRDLENFQKARIRQKLKRGRNGGGSDSVPGSPVPHRRREFVMYNKAPLWNENSQVYQLDFGGRVTQESAKNFQIEFKGKQVMQFGRIDGNAYTLDFQYPFTAIQAFAVALANVTQRLK